MRRRLAADRPADRFKRSNGRSEALHRFRNFRCDPAYCRNEKFGNDHRYQQRPGSSDLRHCRLRHCRRPLRSRADAHRRSEQSQSLKYQQICKGVRSVCSERTLLYLLAFSCSSSLTFASIRRSGISHIAATPIYKAPEIHTLTKASGIAKIYITSEALPFTSPPTADANTLFTPSS